MRNAAAMGSELDEDSRPVRPNGLSVRRLRHERGWSPRDFIDEIARASLRANGLRETITPKELSCIEELGEAIAYRTLMLLAAGLDCDPSDIPSAPIRTTEGERS